MHVIGRRRTSDVATVVNRMQKSSAEIVNKTYM